MDWHQQDTQPSTDLPTAQLMQEPELWLPAESGRGPWWASTQVTQLHFVRIGLKRRCLNTQDWWKMLWSLLISSEPWHWYPGKVFTIYACSKAVSYDINSHLYGKGAMMRTDFCILEMLVYLFFLMGAVQNTTDRAQRGSNWCRLELWSTFNKGRKATLSSCKTL